VPLPDNRPKPAPRFFDLAPKSESFQDKNEGERPIPDIPFPMPRKIITTFQPGINFFTDYDFRNKPLPKKWPTIFPNIKQLS